MKTKIKPSQETRDDAILHTYLDEELVARAGELPPHIQVQANKRTAGWLCYRIGIKRPRRGNFYAVPILPERDAFSRLQVDVRRLPKTRGLGDSEAVRRGDSEAVRVGEEAA